MNNELEVDSIIDYSSFILNSFETIERVYKKLSDKNHKVAYNVNFIDTLDIVKIVENK
jgi:hypothetical protein